ncbi:MAG TPA: peptidylprolyl isomerase [Bacteroidota bacterium]|nr:peptidylprolyl isomerase [Bacteroidota bacterium]
MSAVHRVLVTLFLSMMIYACAPKTSDIVVLEVGPSKVTMSEYESFFTRNSGGWDVAKQSSMEERERFLDLLTNYKLKLRDAYDKNLINDSDIVRELREYRTSLASTYILDRELTEPGVKLLYERRKEYIRPQHILLSLKPDASPEETLKAYSKAMEIIRLAASGQSFDSLTMQYSSDPSTKTNRGDLYYITTGTLVKPFEDAMYSIPKGKIGSTPARSSFGYHIIKILDREPTRIVKARHIMSRFKSQTPDSSEASEALARVQGYADSLKKGWDFAKLATKVSEDPGSAPNGGDLGWFERRRWVLPFDEAVFKLRLGETSSIVRTPFGYHIIRIDSQKSIPPFTDAAFRDELKKMYQQHRYSEDFADYVAKMKTEYAFEFNEEAFNALVARLDSTKLIGDSAWDDGIPADVRALPLLKINHRSISVDTVVAALGNRAEFRNTSLRRADLRPRIDRIAESLLLEAKSGKLEAQYPEFASLMKEYDDGVVLYKAEQMEVWNRNVVSDSSLRSYYEEHKAKFMFPEKVNIAEIFVSTDTMAAKLYDSLSRGADFATLAKRHSEDVDLGSKGGERGFLPVDTDSLTKLGTTLQAGEYTEPKQVEEGGFVIVKLLGRQAARQKTFDEAGAELSNSFQDTNSKLLEQQWLDRVKGRYPVKQYKERLVDAFKKAQ